MSLLPLRARRELEMREIRAALAEAEVPPLPGDSGAWAAYERKPAGVRQEAERRMRALMEWERLTEGGMSAGQATARLAHQQHLTRGTIFAWRRMVRDLPRSEWLPALAPKWQGRTTTAACTPEVWEVFKADFLRLEEPSARSCYDRLAAVGAERGWIVPSLHTLTRRVEREIDAALVTYLRKGPRALARTYAAQKRTRAHFHALQGINGDGHTLDVWVTWEDGEVLRPVATVFQDLYSNKIVGWRVDKSESATAARLAFYDVVRDFGIPDFATLDNGRAWASKTMTGGQPTRFRFKVSADEVEGALTALGVQVHWATPYSGQSKPIERAFRDFCDRIARHPAFSGAWAGNSPTTKPDYARIKPVPFETFMEVFAQGIAEHNARKGRRTEVAAGRSFDEAFGESYAISPVKKATAEQLRMAMLAAERVTARKPDGSLHVLGNRYWAEWLPNHIGARLTVRFDPDDLYDDVAIYGEDGRYLGDTQCWAAVGFDSAEAARQHGRRRRAYGAGRIGLMGEAGPEAIMPLSSGMVGARLGGRETRLPLTRLSSGNLGVSVTPFARGGVVSAGPLALAGGRSAESVPDAQRVRLEVALSPDLKARLLEEADGRAQVRIAQAERRIDSGMAGRVKSIQRDPSNLGGGRRR